MTENFFIEEIVPDVRASFASGGILEPRGDIWVYERDGGISFALDPEHAVRGLEGDGRAQEVWKGI